MGAAEASLTMADVQDASGAERIVAAVRRCRSWLNCLFVDSAYERGRLMGAPAHQDFMVEIVRKLPGQVCFQRLPRRWVVEGTFGWVTRWRRLLRDHDRRYDVSDAMIYFSMGALLLRRIVHSSSSWTTQ